MPYKVFISYSRADTVAVRAITDRLQKAAPELDLWLDHLDLSFGENWFDGALKGLEQSNAVAIFVGPDGVGKWEKKEIEIAQIAANGPEGKKNKKKLIPVLLPGATQEQVPAWLRMLTWLPFRRVEDDAALANLRGSVKGQTPREIALLGSTRGPQTGSDRADPEPEGTLKDSALEALSVTVSSGDRVTFFVGPQASEPPAPFTIARKLLAGC